MAVTFGRIEEFDGAKEEWSQYEERLGHFFTANGVESAEKKHSIFLSVVGPATYKLIRSLVAPVKLGNKTYKELVKLLNSLFNLPPSEIKNNQVVDVEVDTGAACSPMSEVSFRELWPSCKLLKADLCLCTYSGQPIPMLGTLTINVKCKDQVYREPLLVVKGDGPDLFGRNWLDHIRLDWQEIKYLQQNPLQTVLKRHEDVFHGGL